MTDVIERATDFFLSNNTNCQNQRGKLVMIKRWWGFCLPETL